MCLMQCEQPPRESGLARCAASVLQGPNKNGDEKQVGQSVAGIRGCRKNDWRGDFEAGPGPKKV